MTQPPAGWHPDPQHPNLLRYWDGQQWTGHTQPLVQQPTTPPQKSNKSALKVVGALAVVLVALGAFVSISGSDDDEPDTTASAPTTTTTVPRVTTTSRPETGRPPAPAPAESATEAGCEEPDPSIVEAIKGSIDPGFTLTNIAAVTTRVDDIEYTYTAGDVYEGESRKYSMVVWITPGFGVFGLSSNAERASDLPDGSFLDATYPGDDYSVQATDCVMALALGKK